MQSPPGKRVSRKPPMPQRSSLRDSIEKDKAKFKKARTIPFKPSNVYNIDIPS